MQCGILSSALICLFWKISLTAACVKKQASCETRHYSQNISAWFVSKSVSALVHFMNRHQDKFPDFLQNADSENLCILKHFRTLVLWIRENLQLLCVVFEYLRPADMLLCELWGLRGGLVLHCWFRLSRITQLAHFGDLEIIVVDKAPQYLMDWEAPRNDYLNGVTEYTKFCKLCC